MPVSVAASFHRFPELPPEIRHAIWKLCWPHRVCDMDQIPCAEDVAFTTACLGVGMTGFLNSLPPVIAQVCRESRALFSGRHTAAVRDAVLAGEDLLAPESRDFGCYADMDWFDPGTDIVHLNVCK